MSSALTQAHHHPHRLAGLNAFGVQELTAAEAMATNGGVAPLFLAIAGIVAADAAILSAGVALLAFFASRSETE